MYCPNCGKEVEDLMRFCPTCGFNLEFGKPQSAPAAHTNQSEIMFRRKKSAAVAVIMSLFVTGLGQFYVGKALRGTVLLIAMIVSFFVMPYLLLFSLVHLALWVFGMYDAYRLVQEYNDYLLANEGREPW